MPLQVQVLDFSTAQEIKRKGKIECVTEADEANPTLKRLARTTGQATAWEVEKSHMGAYAGGKVAIAERGGYAACQYGADVAFLRSFSRLSPISLST